MIYDLSATLVGADNLFVNYLLFMIYLQHWHVPIICLYFHSCQNSLKSMKDHQDQDERGQNERLSQ